MKEKRSDRLLERAARRARALNRAMKNNRLCTSLGEGRLTGSGINETNAGHRVPSSPSGHRESQYQHIARLFHALCPTSGLCPCCCSLCPDLLQVSSSGESLWTLSSLLPSLRGEAAFPCTTKALIPLAANKLQLPSAANSQDGPPPAAHLCPSFPPACPEF